MDEMIIGKYQNIKDKEKYDQIDNISERMRAYLEKLNKDIERMTSNLKDKQYKLYNVNPLQQFGNKK